MGWFRKSFFFFGFINEKRFLLKPSLATLYHLNFRLNQEGILQLFWLNKRWIFLETTFTRVFRHLGNLIMKKPNEQILLHHRRNVRRSPPFIIKTVKKTQFNWSLYIIVRIPKGVIAVQTGLWHPARHLFNNTHSRPGRQAHRPPVHTVQIWFHQP